LEGKYTFQSHSFSDLTLLLISTQNTSWEPVLRIKFAQDIFPISDAATLHTFVDFITKMGNYVETLLSQGPSSNSVITFDTTNKTLSIDGVIIPVNESATR
jgi:hypothetical protein